jgi:hypothetical protein
MNKLAKFGQFEGLENVKHVDDIIDQPLTVNDFRLANGRQGTYAFIECVTKDGEVINLMCGGAFVLEALIKAKEAKAFPCEATFYRKGRAILLR